MARYYAPRLQQVTGWLAWHRATLLALVSKDTAFVHEERSKQQRANECANHHCCEKASRAVVHDLGGVVHWTIVLVVHHVAELVVALLSTPHVRTDGKLGRWGLAAQCKWSGDRTTSCWVLNGINVRRSSLAGVILLHVIAHRLNMWRAGFLRYRETQNTEQSVPWHKPAIHCSCAPRCGPPGEHTCCRRYK